MAGKQCRTLLGGVVGDAHEAWFLGLHHLLRHVARNVFNDEN